MKRFTPLIACVALLSVGMASGSELVVNGDFETGDFTGWTSSLNTSVGGAGLIGSVSPISGSEMAMFPLFGVLDADIQQSIDVTGLSQIGLSFSYNLAALRVVPDIGLGEDTLTVTIGGVTVLSESLNDFVGGGATTTGWTNFSTTIPTSAFSGTTISLIFAVDSFTPGGDPTQAFITYLDNVSVEGVPTGSSVVPEPGSVAVWGLAGIVGLVALRRRK